MTPVHIQTARRHEPGLIHTWTFDQDEKWVDIAGCEHTVATMPIDYIKNVLVFLQNGAERFRWAYVCQKPLRYDDASDLGPLYDPEVFDQHARRWLLDLPLVQELMRRIVAEQPIKQPTEDRVGW